MYEHLFASLQSSVSSFAIIAPGAPEEEATLRVALDSLHGDYATVIGALTTISITSAAHNSNIKLVVAEDPGARTGDLASIHRDNLGVGVFKDEYTDLKAYNERGLHLIGDIVGSPLPQYPNGTIYIRQKRSTNYGDNSGRTYGDALNGPEFTHLSGYRYVYCGNIWFESTFANQNLSTTGGVINFTDCTGIDPLALDMAHELAPGLLHNGMTWNGQGSALNWVNHSGNIWKRGDFGGWNRGVFNNALPQKDTDPTLSAKAILDYHLIKAASLGAITSGNFWHDGMAQTAFDAVIRETSAAFTDYTAEAGNDTANDVIIWADAAANNDAIYFGRVTQFSTIFQNGGGAAGPIDVWEYWNGSSWTALPEIHDFTNGLINGGSTANPNGTRFTFNIPNNWATTTVNSQGAFYYIRLRKTGGTVSGAKTKTRFWAQNATLYVNRYDDTTVTRTNEPLLRWDVSGVGYSWDLDGKGNYDLYYTRTLGGQRQRRNTCLDLRVYGGQWILDDGSSGSLFAAGSMEHHYMAGTIGRRLYSVADRIDRNSNKVDHTHPWVTNNLISKWECSLSDFNDMDDWFELCYVAEGLYCTSTGGMDIWNINGTFVRNLGMIHSNALGQIRDDTSGATGDHHSLGLRGNGGTNSVNWTWTRFCLLYVSSAINIYIPASGGTADTNNNGPMQGSCSNFHDITISKFIIAEYNGIPDNQQPLAGIVFNGDNDTTRYDDGSGILDNVVFDQFVVANLDQVGGSDPGDAISPNIDQMVEYKRFSVIRCNHIYRNNRGGMRNSFSAVLQNDASEATFVDLTQSVKATGNIDSNFFPTPAAVGDACYFAMKSHTHTRLNVNIPALMGATGTYTLAYEYWNGSTWAALTIIQDNTNNLSTTGFNTLRWERPSDWATATINSIGPMYWMRVRLASGAFTTQPIFNEARSSFLGANYYIHDFYFEDIQEALFWDRPSDTSFSSGVYRVDNFTGVLLPGQTIASTLLCAYGTTGSANQTLGQWQANQKLAINTDALEDSIFMSNVSLTPGVHITELAA